MDIELTVRQVAQMTGLSEHTLRYYERSGLIPPVDRAGNGHRRYSQQDIEWIQFVRRLRSAGMSIAIVQRYVALQRQGSATRDERLELLKAHRQSVQQQIEELLEHLALIEHKIAYYTTLENQDDVDCP